MAAAAEEPKDEGEAVEEEVKGIKMSEVEQHSSIDDLWLVIDGKGQRAYTSRASPCVHKCTRRASRVSFDLFFFFFSGRPNLSWRGKKPCARQQGPVDWNERARLPS